MVNCIAQDLDFSDCELIKSDFSNSDLKGSRFNNCILEKSNFSNSTNYNINPTTNKIKGSNFSYPEAINLLDSFDIIINP